MLGKDCWLVAHDNLVVSFCMAIDNCKADCPQVLVTRILVSSNRRLLNLKL